MYPESASLSSPPDLAAIRAEVADELRAVDELIRTRLHTDVPLIDQLAQHILASGGKRLRPLLVLLAARTAGYSGSDHIELAAVIEFIHTATLLHDDVVDGAELRRGRLTANTLWGNTASVLVGDFLYSRAFQMMVGVGRMRVMELLAETTNTIAAGEVMQLLHCHDPSATEERYLEVIYRKTAKLFEAAAQLGAVLAGSGKAEEQALKHYGRHLGMAFQLVDDVLDLCAAPAETGKNLGTDLAEGKPTLPLIRALNSAAMPEAEILRDAIRHGARGDTQAIMAALESTDAMAYTAARAQAESLAAIEQLAHLPATRFRGALHQLAAFCVQRNF